MNHPTEAGVIDIWQISLNASPSDYGHLQSLLDTHEQQRLQKLHPSKTSSFLISHIACRQILSRYCELKASDIQYHYNSHRKPSLLKNRNIKFNLSHSGEYALLAIGKHELGIDIESCKPRTSLPRLANRFFASEETEFLMAHPEHLQAALFYKIWTHKEAYLKAIGTGIATPLPSFSVIHNNKFEPHCLNTITKQPDYGWHQAEINAADNYKAALTIETPIIKIQYFNYEILPDGSQI
jgi:4'-phosphopantetheinyl transferase